VDQILHTHNTVFAEILFDQLIVAEGDALLVDLAVTALVNKLTNGLQVGITIGDIWVDNGEHLGGGLGETDKDTVVDLEETEKLQNLAGLGSNLVDTLDTDDKDQLGLFANVEGAILFAQTSKTNLLTLRITVFLDI